MGKTALSYNPGAGKHLERALRVKSGETIPEIAKADGVSEKAVQKSLRIVNVNRARHSDEFLKEELIRIAMKLGPGTMTAVAGALEATYDVTKNDNGKEVTVQEPDHSTRLKAVEQFVEIAKAAQPKTGGNINVGMGVNVGGTRATPTATGSYVGMEDRLRAIRQEIAQRPQLEERTVTTATLEQPGGDILDGDDDEDDDE
jgi:hypothetical protein